MHNQKHNIISKPTLSLAYTLDVMKNSVYRKNREWYCKELSKYKKIYLFVRLHKQLDNSEKTIRKLKMTQAS